MNLISAFLESVTTTIVIVGAIVAISILYNIWKHQRTEDNHAEDK